MVVLFAETGEGSEIFSLSGFGRGGKTSNFVSNCDFLAIQDTLSRSITFANPAKTK